MRTNPTLPLTFASLAPLQIRSQYSIARSRVLSIMHVPSYTGRIMSVLALLLALVVSTEAMCCKTGGDGMDPSAGPECKKSNTGYKGCWECGSAGQPQQCVHNEGTYCAKERTGSNGCNMFGCNCDGGCSNSGCPSVRRALMSSESQHPWTNATAWTFLSE
jgi:hypothetical protein